jgi:hypothetical protein
VNRWARACAFAATVVLIAVAAVPAASAAESSAAPAADVSEELDGGNGVFLGSAAGGFDAEDAGYVETERVAEGTATAYVADGELSEDGRWTLERGESAPYRTRILVRRPAKAKDFNGTVVVEWLNVSGGLDADPEFANTADELVRRGYAWIGVSAQTIGVMGGPVLVPVSIGADLAGKGLVGVDPERYGTLSHPGDGFAFDIYTQVANAARRSKKGGLLGPLKAERIIAAGQSQSAFALVTYVNGVQPQTRAFDGFFVHSRGGSSLPLVGPGESADIAGAIAATPKKVRTDTKVPVIILQSESDVGPPLNSLGARQRDTKRIRLWEVAGTAHADRYLTGAIVDSIGCKVDVNDGPMHVVAKAAMRGLDTWIRTGNPPPKAKRLAVDEDGQLVRDELGIVEGGLRTPPVENPVVVLSSDAGPDPSIICLLLGSTTPMTPEQIADRYDSRAQYKRAYARGTAEAIADRYVLKADREALLDYSDPSKVQP